MRVKWSEKGDFVGKQKGKSCLSPEWSGAVHKEGKQRAKAQILSWGCCWNGANCARCAHSRTSGDFSFGVLFCRKSLCSLVVLIYQCRRAWFAITAQLLLRHLLWPNWGGRHLNWRQLHFHFPNVCSSSLMWFTSGFFNWDWYFLSCWLLLRVVSNAIAFDQ